MTWQPERPEFSDEMKAEFAKALDDISAVHERFWQRTPRLASFA